MFVHAVYWWLKPGLTAEQHKKFEEGVASLATIESVVHGFIGTPAYTDRPVIDRTYSRAAVIVFADTAGHDVYQNHPTHTRFRDECSGLWQRVLIYDSE